MIKFENVIKFGEVMLSPRGLYPTAGGHQNTKVGSFNQQEELDSLNWLLFECDGEQTLIDIVIKRKLNFDITYKAIKKCLKAGVIEQR
jgi:aminopeptidase-like protein